MDLKKIVHKSFIAGSAFLTAASLATLLNYSKHENRVYETEDFWFKEMADFPLTYTRLKIGKNEPYFEITKVNMFNYRFYREIDKDGFVDEVFFAVGFPFIKPKAYDCKKDSEENNEICKKANEEFEQELIRFRD